MTENKCLKNDNEDLQHEFERDRQGYLNTIRVQEKQLLLYRSLLDKMSSMLHRNCNYSNIDKIIEQSRFDEEKNEYIIPDPIVEEVQFPQLGNLHTTNGRSTRNDFIPSSKAPLPPSTNYEYDFLIPSQANTNNYHHHIGNMDTDELERRYGRNTDPSTISLGNVRNKRQEQLLNQNNLVQTNNTKNDYMNRRLNPFEAPTRLTRKYGFTTDKQ